MAKRACDVISFGGLGNLRRKVSLRLDCLEPKSKPSVKKLFGFMDLMKRFSLDDLRSVWGGFLKGEELLLPCNQLTVRTYGSVVPDRAAADRLAKSITSEGNPYLKLSDKLDNAIKIERSFVEDSVRVSYFRMDKEDHLDRARVLMKVDFAVKVKLKEPIRAVGEELLRYPRSVENAAYFYPMVKACFENPSAVTYDRDHGYFAAPCATDEAGNWRFALDLKLGPSSLKVLKAIRHDLYTFGSLWKELESDGKEHGFFKTVNVLGTGMAPFADFRRSSLNKPVVAEDLREAVEFLKIFPEKVGSGIDDKYSINYLVHGGLQIYFHGRNEEIRKYVRELSAGTLEQVQSLLALHESAVSYDRNRREWDELTDNLSLEECLGAEFSPYDKYLAAYWIEKIKNDPLVFTDHSCKCIRNYAQCLVSGVPYGS
ncbi:hypothetical protein [Fibrobacter sp. UWEL]|uniref:hypothetical protein n=1 Tax=Fibrobacter sp. UWEL TaxID=1896209 RepID=UPI0009232D2B|nr:hypothetical protein [Fibrobacter sp. UWEL]SHL28425.1 hypothetical protein SAMN05720468_12039 [Fibrobacter sp. UWEL]